MDTLPTINPEQITFIDYVEAGEKLASQLKKEVWKMVNLDIFMWLIFLYHNFFLQGCDYVIALTHMRTPNDVQLAEKVQDIDLILGGHDHVFEVKKINDKYIIKSGTDFRQFSKISLSFTTEPRITVEEVKVTKSYEEDPAMTKHLEKYSGSLFRTFKFQYLQVLNKMVFSPMAGVFEGKLNEVLGCFAVPLDGRFSSVRTGETNLGNWICDVVLAATNADCVLINSGTLRSDTVHAAGDFTLGDLTHVIPMMDPLVLLSVTGNISPHPPSLSFKS